MHDYIDHLVMMAYNKQCINTVRLNVTTIKSFCQCIYTSNSGDKTDNSHSDDDVIIQTVLTVYNNDSTTHKTQ